MENKKKNDLYLQALEDKIYVEPVTSHTIIVDSRKEIDRVNICPLIGGGCSITLTFKEEE